MSSSPPTAGLPEGSIPIPSLTLEVDSDDADHIASEGTERLLGKLKNIKGIGNIDRVSQNTGKRIVIAYGTLDACPKFVRTGNHMGKGILKSIADDLGCTQPLRHFRQPYYLEVLDFPNPPSPAFEWRMGHLLLSVHFEHVAMLLRHRGFIDTEAGRMRIRPFNIRALPMLCFACQKIGSKQNECSCKKRDGTHRYRCGNCAGPHRTLACPGWLPIKCANCGGPHTARDVKKCPKLRDLKLVGLNRLPFWARQSALKKYFQDAPLEPKRSRNKAGQPATIIISREPLTKPVPQSREATCNEGWLKDSNRPHAPSVESDSAAPPEDCDMMDSDMGHTTMPENDLPETTSNAHIAPTPSRLSATAPSFVPGVGSPFTFTVNNCSKLALPTSRATSIQPTAFVEHSTEADNTEAVDRHADTEAVDLRADTEAADTDAVDHHANTELPTIAPPTKATVIAVGATIPSFAATLTDEVSSPDCLFTIDLTGTRASLSDKHSKYPNTFHADPSLKRTISNSNSDSRDNSDNNGSMINAGRRADASTLSAIAMGAATIPVRAIGPDTIDLTDDRDVADPANSVPDPDAVLATSPTAKEATRLSLSHKRKFDDTTAADTPSNQRSVGTNSAYNTESDSDTTDSDTAAAGASSEQSSHQHHRKRKLDDTALADRQPASKTAKRGPATTAEAKEEAMRKKAEIENRTIATPRGTAKTKKKKQQTAQKANTRTIATPRKTAKTKKQQTAKKAAEKAAEEAAEAVSKPQSQRTLDDVVSSIPPERIKAPVVPENYLDQPPPESSVLQPRADDSFYTDAS